MGIVTDGCFMHLSNLLLKKFLIWAGTKYEIVKIWLNFVDDSCKKVPTTAFKISMKPDLVPKTKNRMARCYLSQMSTFSNLGTIEEYWKSEKKGDCKSWIAFCNRRKECLQVASSLIMISEVKIYI